MTEYKTHKAPPLSVFLLLQIWMVALVGMLALVPRRMDLIFTEPESLRS